MAERIHPYLELSSELLTSLLEKEFPSPSKFTLIREGGCNTSYTFTSKGKNFWLSFRQRDETPPSHKIEAINTLLKGSVSTPELLYKGSHKKVFFEVYPYIEGKALTRVDSTLSALLGETLAKIHSVTFETGSFCLSNKLSDEDCFKKGSSPYYESCFVFLDNPILQQRLGIKLERKIHAFLENHQDLFITAGDCFELVHADFKPENILVTPEGNIVVTDWEFAHRGHGIFDIAILMRYKEVIGLNIEHFSAAYKAHGGYLRKDWVKQAEAYDILNKIILLGAKADRPELYAFILKSLEKLT